MGKWIFKIKKYKRSIVIPGSHINGLLSHCDEKLSFKTKDLDH